MNLGGVLVNLHKLDEAWDYNVHAVLVRPNDALANAQLGMTYFELGNLELAEKYLARARQILWLITGSDKKGPLAKFLAGDTTIPAGRVEAGASLVLADRAAT